MKKVALIGNPNCGKSTLFNLLTGLSQKTGNFSGVTVDKKTGTLRAQDEHIQIMDLPGTYSLHPLTEDEHVVLRVLLNPNPEERPDAIVFIADSTQLDKHLLLYTQIRDLGYPIFLALSMIDIAKEKNIDIDLDQLESKLGHPVLSYDARNAHSVEAVQNAIVANRFSTPSLNDFYFPPEETSSNGLVGEMTPYGQILHAYYLNEPATATSFSEIDLDKDSRADDLAAQVHETMERCDRIESLLANVYSKKSLGKSKSYEADRWLTHSVWGPLVFAFVMFLVFQAIFTLAEWPMNLIDGLFAGTSQFASELLPGGWVTDLIAEGIIPGLAGVIIFIPQIAILFFLIGLLEESGYMSRAIFLFDKLFRKLGLHGRSLLALVSASACAIPAVMSARAIKNEKERLITILVTPFISCSARTPVYIVLIAFIVSSDKVAGWINPQGLVFAGFYMLGLIAAILFAWVLKKVFSNQAESYLMLEMPDYKWPDFRSVLWYTWTKVRSFIVEAGKIILIISIALWFLASYGPSDREEQVLLTMESIEGQMDLDEDTRGQLTQSLMLEHSYAGHLGKAIEPVIKPLGFDWKIGIALITSFAAREVFVSTMATIYSVESEEDYVGIQAQMQRERHVDTLQPVYTQATALSLVVFYIFAMQCMSTLAVVKKETGTWKWPIFQFIGMTLIAYAGAWLVQVILG